MQASNKPINLTKEHLQVLEYIDVLFARWSLRKNAYLFKHIKYNLQIPLYIIAEERRISQITQNQNTLIEALKLSQYAQVNQQARMVRLLELPTVRVTDQANLLRVEDLVKNYIKQKVAQDKINSVKPIQYVVSSKTDDGYYYIVLKTKNQKDKSILKNLIQKFNKSQTKQKIKYTQQPMYEDIKDGVNKFRKSKRQYMQNNQNNQKYSKGNYYNNNNNSYETDITNPVYSKQNMMIMYPGVYYPTYSNLGVTPEQMHMQYQMQEQKVYHTFIRKAVESDDEEEDKYEDLKKKKYEEKVEKKEQERQQEYTQEAALQKLNINDKGQQTNKLQKTLAQKSQEQTNNSQPNGHKPNTNSIPINPNSNSNNTNQSPNQHKKSDHHKNKDKKNNHHSNNNHNNNHKDKQKQKQPKVKVVLDDSDFPTIG